MEIVSVASNIRISARKVRVVAHELVGLKVKVALESLKYVNRRSAPLLGKVLKTAMSDAVNNFNLKENNLWIKEVIVEDGPTLKRFRARSRGMASSIKKRTAHIKVKLQDSSLKRDNSARLVKKTEVKEKTALKDKEVLMKKEVIEKKKAKEAVKE